MKQIMKTFLGAVILLSTYSTYAALGFNTPIMPRSQSVRVSRELAGHPNYLDPCNACRTYGTFSLTGWADRTFDSDKVAECLFGNKQLTFSGRSVANRPGTHLLADYWGLPEDFQSTVTFEPRVENLGLDFTFHIGLNRLLHGLYLRIHTPLVHTRWDLHAVESNITEGTIAAPQGYYGQNGVLLEGTPLTTSTLHSRILNAFRGTKNVGNLEALKFGKIDGKQSFTRLSDVHFALGYNFICDEDYDYHMGLNLRFSAPAGAKPTAKFLFEPMVGDAGRWNIGGGLTAHRVLLRDDAELKSLALHLDARLTHVLGRAQLRSFDLKGKPGSRYMIIQQLGTEQGATTLVAPSANTLALEYQGQANPNVLALFPAINKTTLLTKVSNTLQADILLKLSYQNNSLTADFGYELWARTKDEIRGREKADFDANFAIKGDAHVVGFSNGVGNPAVRLAATQSGATLFRGTNQGLTTPASNPGVDNLVLAVSSDGGNVETATASGTQTRTSVQPELLRDDLSEFTRENSSIDEDSAMNKSMVTHTVFAHVDYSIVRENDECFIPSFGLGASGEFAHRHLTSKNDAAEFTRGCALSQWSIWFKAGISF